MCILSFLDLTEICVLELSDFLLHNKRLDLKLETKRQVLLLADLCFIELCHQSHLVVLIPDVMALVHKLLDLFPNDLVEDLSLECKAYHLVDRAYED